MSNETLLPKYSDFDEKATLAPPTAPTADGGDARLLAEFEEKRRRKRKFAKTLIFGLIAWFVVRPVVFGFSSFCSGHFRGINPWNAQPQVVKSTPVSFSNLEDVTSPVITDFILALSGGEQVKKEGRPCHGQGRHGRHGRYLKIDIQDAINAQFIIAKGDIDVPRLYVASMPAAGMKKRDFEDFEESEQVEFDELDAADMVMDTYQDGEVLTIHVSLRGG